MARWIIWPLIVLILFVLLYIWFYGGFSQVIIYQDETGPYTLCYEVHKGDYRKINKVMDRVFKDLKSKDDVFTTRGFGLYYDKPGDVDTDSLRSIGGCILPEDLDPQSLTGGYKIAEYPRTPAAIAEFPHRGKASVIFGVMKAYPALTRYMKDHEIPDAPVLEIYDVPAKKIFYIVPLGLEPGLLINYMK
jgi:effector-binding domain-containing protein